MPAERVFAPFLFSYAVPGDISLIEKAEDASGYILEPKLDGFRIQMELTDSEIHTYTRTSHVADGKMPAVEGAILPRVPQYKYCVFDGEAVVFDGSGMADFNATARCMGSQTDECVRKQRASGNFVTYVIFDCLRWCGQDMTAEPYRVRMACVKDFVSAINNAWVEDIQQAPVSLENHWRFTDDYGEGSVLKNIESPYMGRRHKAWTKIKKVADADVVIMGATTGRGKYEGQIGAVIFGQYLNGVLKIKGQCSGMTDKVRREFTDALPIGRVMTISHMGFSAPGSEFPSYRHPQFRRLRDPIDKAAEDCIWES